MLIWEINFTYSKESIGSTMPNLLVQRDNSTIQTPLFYLSNTICVIFCCSHTGQLFWFNKGVLQSFLSSVPPCLPTLPLWNIRSHSPGWPLQCFGTASSVCRQNDFEGVTVLPQATKEAFHSCKWWTCEVLKRSFSFIERDMEALFVVSGHFSYGSAVISMLQCGINNFIEGPFEDRKSVV